MNKRQVFVSAAAILTAATPFPVHAADPTGDTPIVTIAPFTPSDVMFGLPSFDEESETATGRDDPTTAAPEKARVKAGESLFVFAHDICRRVGVSSTAPGAALFAPFKTAGEWRSFTGVPEGREKDPAAGYSSPGNSPASKTTLTACCPPQRASICGVDVMLGYKDERGTLSVTGLGTSRAEFQCTNGEWSLKSVAGSCGPTVPDFTCPATQRTWEVDGKRCSAPLSSSNAPNSRSRIFDLTQPNTGNALYTCLPSGSWASEPEPGATCVDDSCPAGSAQDPATGTCVPLKTRTTTVTRDVFACEFAFRGCGKDTDHRGVTRTSEQTVTETQDVVTGRWVETARSPWTVTRTKYSCPCDVEYLPPSAGGGHGGEAKGSRDTTGDGTTDSPGEGSMSDSSPNGVGSAAGVGHGVGGGAGSGGAGDPTGGAVSCFTGETEISMADGSTKPISFIRRGDRVKSQKGTSQVIGIETPNLGARLLYGLNGGPGFFTAEHPFMDAAGWVSVDPSATAEENPAVFVTKMKVGDWLVTIGQPEEWVVIKSIDSHDIDEPNRTVYNLILDGDHTYYADGYLVHNKY